MTEIEEIQVDEETQEFVKWSFAKLDDDVLYREMINEALAEAAIFYNQPKDIVLKQLRKKMLRGAVEHGAPTHTVQKVQEELINEYTDLVGWLLVKKWVEKKLEPTHD